MADALHSPARVVGTFGAHRDLRPREIDELERLGVNPDALIGPPPVLAGFVHWVRSDRFEFDHHSPTGPTVRAFLFLVDDMGGEPVDVVAWSPQVERLGTWLGRAWALGEGRVFAPRLTEALPVHRDPLGWLQADRRGLVILNEAMARHYLDAAGPLLAEDPAHRRALNFALTARAPRILVPRSPNNPTERAA